MKEDIKIVKIGGNVIDNPTALRSFIEGFAKLSGPKALIHGGGKEATRLSGKLGIETQMVNGRRVTDRETLDVVTMAYAGLINKRIVALLQAAGCDAIGLCGADANVIKATRRPAVPFDYGYVGDINPTDINTAFIRNMLDNGVTPVFCAINHDGNGELLNCNADSVASAVAIACSEIAPTDLTFCFEKEGVLSDVDDQTSLIRSVNGSNYADLKNSGAISGGMLPKIDNAFAAVSKGVRSVTIKSSSKLLDDTGTKITL